MENIKKWVKLFKENGIPKDEAVTRLKIASDLHPLEKNVIYMYCYPRPLPDYGLPPRIQEHRLASGVGAYGDPTEIAFILEACQTEQYGRFMKHIMHAFGDPELVFPIAGEGEGECCICGKEVYEYSKWSQDYPDDTEKHMLCFGSKDSSVVLCVDCLLRLVKAIEVINEIDPGFLDWTKRAAYQKELDKIVPF